jgi:uncharacterized protein (DUF433 family)
VTTAISIGRWAFAAKAAFAKFPRDWCYIEYEMVSKPGDKIVSRRMPMSGPTTPHHPFRDRIVRDRQVCGGEPVFRGTRVLLRTVLASLAAGEAAEDILADFPSLKADDIRAAIAFAAASAEEDLPVPAVPNVQ